MILRCRRPHLLRKDDGTHGSHAMRFSKQLLELDMKWETPQATDFRFGMEITMYIANR